MDDGGSPGMISLKRMFSRPVSKLFGVQLFKDLEDVTEEEIISMVNEGHEQGVLLASEAEMIQNIFEFGDKEAKDIMTQNPKTIDKNDLVVNALELMRKKSITQLPVMENGNYIGMIHIHDIIKEGII